MESTSLKRKTSLRTDLFSVDYLGTRELLKDLSAACELLHGKLLDLGCGNRPYLELLKNASSYLGYDIDNQDSQPDIIGTSQYLPFRSGCFDSVLSTQVLEHVPEPWMMVEEIARVLRPEGQLLISAPQAWRLHEEPHDYFRYTHYGLRSLLQRSNLMVTEVRIQGGSWALIGQTTNNTIWRNPIRKWSPSWLLRKVCTLLLNSIFGLLDKLFVDHGDVLNYVIIARKHG